jgi:hypothetical protein
MHTPVGTMENTMNRRFLLALLCLAALKSAWVPLSPPAWADIVPAGKKWANYGVEFTGLEAFPEYIFLAYMDRSGYLPSGAGDEGSAPLRLTELGPGVRMRVHTLTLGHVEIVVHAVEEWKYEPSGMTKNDLSSHPRGVVRVARVRRNEDYEGILLADRVLIDERSSVVRVDDLLQVKDVGAAAILFVRGKRRHVHADGSVEEFTPMGDLGATGSVFLTALFFTVVAAVTGRVALLRIRKRARSPEGEKEVE